jgi:uncharacterized protein (TIGR03437 family)
MKCVLLSVLLAALPALAAHIVYQQNIPATLVALDPGGNVYVTGSPTVTKLTPQGNIIYSKQITGLGDWWAIAADSTGDLVIVGSTTSDNLPTTPGVFQPKRNSSGACVSGDMAAQPVPCPDAFMAKLDSNGNLVWVTYLGGSSTDQAKAVAVDAAGNIYVAGLTESSDFYSVSAFQPALGGYADGFIAKISADGTAILYSSFMGGLGYDVANAVAVDAAGNAYVAGQVQGLGLAVTPGSFGPSCGSQAINAFLIKVAPGGDRLVFGGCLGGDESASQATAVALDGQGTAYIGGSTNSRSFPTTPGAFRSLSVAYADFVTKISADGSTLAYSSLFDGGSFGVYSIAVDSTGSAYATASTASPAMPILGPAMQPCPGPASLIYNVLLQLNPAGSQASYFSYEEAPGRVALSADGSLYEAFGQLRKITALDAAGDSFFSSQCVLNGASLESHLEYGQPGISPGEIVTLKGTRLGPSAAPPVAFGLTPPTSLAGVQVFFDGRAAPLLYVQDSQVNVLAPYELAGETQTSIQVQFNNQMSPPVVLPVAATSAAVFGSFNGTPPVLAPLVFNQDFSVNGVGNPASRGSAVVLFITGGGQTSPPSVDGEIWHTVGGLQVNVSAQIQNVPSSIKVAAPLLYSGPAPDEVSGVQQLNFQIPAGLPPGNSFLNVTIGTQSISVAVALN